MSVNKIPQHPFLGGRTVEACCEHERARLANVSAFCKQHLWNVLLCKYKPIVFVNWALDWSFYLIWLQTLLNITIIHFLCLLSENIPNILHSLYLTIILTVFPQTLLWKHCHPPCIAKPAKYMFRLWLKLADSSTSLCVCESKLGTAFSILPTVEMCNRQACLYCKSIYRFDSWVCFHKQQHISYLVLQ